MRKHLLILMPSALLCLSAQATGVTDIGPLMETARTQGRAEGTLGGEVMERMRAMGIDRPVEVSVTRLHRLRDPGCARLNVEFLQRSVLMPGESAPRDRHASFQMNWCEGGRPPSSAEGAQPMAETSPKRQANERKPQAASQRKEVRR